MKRSTTRLTVALAALLIGIQGPTLAEKQPDAVLEPGRPEQDPATAAWLAYANPNEHHKHLERLVGKWHAEVSAWSRPGAQTVTMEGEVENVMIVGGRFLYSVYTGEYDHQPFVGIRIDGYDNHLQRHTTTWMDSINTATHHYEGTCENDGATIKMKSRQYDPVSGKTIRVTTVTTIVNDDLYTYDQWNQESGGKPFKVMAMRYTRKK